jgi:hypothetical protein
MVKRRGGAVYLVGGGARAAGAGLEALIGALHHHAIAHYTATASSQSRQSNPPTTTFAHLAFAAAIALASAVSAVSAVRGARARSFGQFLKHEQQLHKNKDTADDCGRKLKPPTASGDALSTGCGCAAVCAQLVAKFGARNQIATKTRI